MAAAIAPALRAQAPSACSGITDPAQRLACYDARDRAPAPAQPAPRPAAPAPPPTAPTPLPPVAAVPVSPPASVPTRQAEARQERGSRDIDSQIVAVEKLRHGLTRMTLADGSVWSTTVAVVPPQVGDQVHIRYTLLGAKYLTIPGRRPITVRPER